MNRRDFIKAALAIPAIAALPAPVEAQEELAEELLDGITYVSRYYETPDGVMILETWRKAGGKIWRLLATEDEILGLTEMPFAPFVVIPRFDFASHHAPLTTRGAA